MGTVQITYGKSLLGDRSKSHIATLQKMIGKNLNNVMVFENLAPSSLPLEALFISSQSSLKREAFYFEQFITKCLEHQIIVICNIGSSKQPFGLIEKIVRIAKDLDISQPKIAIDQTIKSLDESSSATVDPAILLREKSTLFYTSLRSGYDLAKCLSSGMQFVFTHHLTYTSLILGALLPFFQWTRQDSNQLASAALLGYLLEGDLQSNIFPIVSQPLVKNSLTEKCQYPIAKVFDDGSFIISKSARMTNNLNSTLVKKLYDMSHPNAFITPEIVVDISRLVVEDLGNNQVKISGAIGHFFAEENIN